jgi:hypothetical protein
VRCLYSSIHPYSLSSGNFKQYATFGQILKKFGYYVEDLRKILDKKLSSGGVSRAAYEGKIEK